MRSTSPLFRRGRSRLGISLWTGRAASSADSSIGKFRESVRRWSLFDKKDRLLVAVSGGIDSVCLLHLLLQLPEKLRPSVEVAHFNHRLRSRQSEGEFRFVKKLCRDWKIPFHGGKAPRWGKNKSNLQARARELRYDFFKKKAAKLGISKILTAHQADDQAETFLIRWIQGAGLKGLSGIPLKREEGGFIFIRPVLFMARHEIEAYARHWKLPFREDPSNASDRYLRSRVRRLLKTLKKENPRVVERHSMNAFLLQADQNLLDGTVQDIFGKNVESGDGRFRCPIRVYQTLPDAMRFRLLQKMVSALLGEGASLSLEAILKMDGLLEDPAPRRHYDLPNRLGFQKDYVTFEIYRKSR